MGAMSVTLPLQLMDPRMLPLLLLEVGSRLMPLALLPLKHNKEGRRTLKPKDMGLERDKEGISDGR